MALSSGAKNVVIAVLLLTNIVSFGILLNGWGRDTHPPSDGAVCTTICYPCDNSDSIPGVNGNLAVALIQNYQQKQWTSFYNNNGSFADARSTWFSLATLKRFIFEIENRTCSSCFQNEKGIRPTLGVRIYYGTYPENDGSPAAMQNWTDFGLDGKVDTMYAGCHTVVLMPTYFNGKKDVDFDPGTISRDSCRPVRISQMFAGTYAPVPTLLALYGGINGKMNMQNHSTMTPPPYDFRFHPYTGNQVPSDGAELTSVTDRVPYQ